MLRFGSRKIVCFCMWSIPRGWSCFGVFCLIRHCNLLSSTGVSGKRSMMMSQFTLFYPLLGFFLLCGSDTLVPFVGAVCLCPGTCVCLRLHLCDPWVVVSDARALVVLSRSLDRPFVTFRFISMAPVAFVIFGSASLISLSFLVTWPADDLHAW